MFSFCKWKAFFLLLDLRSVCFWSNLNLNVVNLKGVSLFDHEPPRSWLFFDRLSHLLNLGTGYSFWDGLHNFLHKFTWIVLSVHKMNKLDKFRGATSAARAPKPGETPIMAASRRCLLFFKIEVWPRSCRSYRIWRPWNSYKSMDNCRVSRHTVGFNARKYTKNSYRVLTPFLA